MFSFHRFTGKTFCRLRKEAQLVENQTCSVSVLHKTTLVWLTLRYSKSDSTHHSAKLVLTKCLRQAGMGQPNQGLVSQQDKRQPSFPHLRGCPFQTTTYCEPVHMSPGAGCLLLQQQTAKSHCTPRTEGLLPRRSVLKAKGNPTCRAGREGTRHDNKTLRGEGCLGH